MTDHLDLQKFHGLAEYGLRNLAAHRDAINSLNVFPVPDGDTGTNMILTLRSGVDAALAEEESLALAAKRFADAVVFGARGNSGVILSQFFRGFCEALSESETADCALVSAALDRGVELAYKSVSNPVEGTMLTVLREASEKVRSELRKNRINHMEELTHTLLAEAKVSLARTPDLLPILRSANVVDSGGEGIVRIFEGMEKYLAGETVEEGDAETSAPAAPRADYSRFNRSSKFEYGYCTELFIQFTDGKKAFDRSQFDLELEALGDSIVTALQDDKLKIHIHSFNPEKVLALCHGYGEFLSLKIENMSVQHDSLPVKPEDSAFRDGPFSVVAVAHTPAMSERFSEFGADKVIFAERGCPPSASDFIAAFEKVPAPIILVFPNSKNAVPVARQAAELYKDSRVAVFATASDTQCYSALPLLDFSEEDFDTLTASVEESIENLVTVTVSKASRGVTLNGRRVTENDYAAMCGSKLLGVGGTPVEAACDAAANFEEEYDVVRIFADSSVSEEAAEALVAAVTKNDPFIEAELIAANDSFCPITLSFE
ncbi:MAG: DAK2 domain-containing protein [Clostridia bacterium]|nr:DAK2 domain-containing protein [Clostridia bacterium]